MTSRETVPKPVFLGFFPKATQLAADMIKAEGVERIASVSGCISRPPDGWVDEWKHNNFGFYDSETTAQEVAEKLIGKADVYAYEAYPLRWHSNGRSEWPITAAPGAVPEDYAFLGFDIVTRDASDFFECSPLSCNAAFEMFLVNEECLLNTEAEALHAAEAMGRSQTYEPGYCHVIRVYRKRS